MIVLQKALIFLSLYKTIYSEIIEYGEFTPHGQLCNMGIYRNCKIIENSSVTEFNTYKEDIRDQELKKALFENYDPLSLPPNNKATKIGMSIQIFGINKVDNMENKAVINC